MSHRWDEPPHWGSSSVELLGDSAQEHCCYWELLPFPLDADQAWKHLSRITASCCSSPEAELQDSTSSFNFHQGCHHLRGQETSFQQAVNTASVIQGFFCNYPTFF